MIDGLTIFSVWWAEAEWHVASFMDKIEFTRLVNKTFLGERGFMEVDLDELEGKDKLNILYCDHEGGSNIWYSRFEDFKEEMLVIRLSGI